eukprot:scaffold106432_cov23-Prasinocladus_malaysianus.AAC.1
MDARQGRLPEDDPNWHLQRLKPWKATDAMARGHKHKQNAASMSDPFQKLFEYEEACKMFNKVLEIKPSSDEARGALNECCSRMNSEYKRMKELKRTIRVKSKAGAANDASWGLSAVQKSMGEGDAREIGRGEWLPLGKKINGLLNLLNQNSYPEDVGQICGANPGKCKLRPLALDQNINKLGCRAVFDTSELSMCANH